MLHRVSYLPIFLIPELCFSLTMLTQCKWKTKLGDAKNTHSTRLNSLSRVLHTSSDLQCLMLTTKLLHGIAHTSANGDEKHCMSKVPKHWELLTYDKMKTSVKQKEGEKTESWNVEEVKTSYKKCRNTSLVNLSKNRRSCFPWNCATSSTGLLTLS